MVWVPGVHDGATYLPEIPASAEYDKLKDVLSRLYDYLNTNGALVTSVALLLPDEIKITLPSKLEIVVARKSRTCPICALDYTLCTCTNTYYPTFNIVDFRLPAQVRTEDEFVFFYTVYRTNRLPYQSRLQNFLYKSNDPVLIPSTHTLFVSNALQWSDDVIRDYTLLNAFTDVGGSALLVLLILSLAYTSFQAVKNLSVVNDSVLLSHVHDVVTDTNNDAELLKTDTEAIKTSLKGLYHGSYF